MKHFGSTPCQACSTQCNFHQHRKRHQLRSQIRHALHTAHHPQCHSPTALSSRRWQTLLDSCSQLPALTTTEMHQRPMTSPASPHHFEVRFLQCPVRQLSHKQRPRRRSRHAPHQTAHDRARGRQNRDQPLHCHQLPTSAERQRRRLRQPLTPIGPRAAPGHR